MIKENIAAIATPLGVGGIGIIRISGPSSIKTINKYLLKDITKQQANTIIYNKFIYNNEVIDEVLVSVFKAPKSFTGEDSVEINSHGGIYIINKILTILLQDSEIRLAMPGEFSKQAFLNGKKTIMELDAACNLIEANNEIQFQLTSEKVLNKTQHILVNIKNQLLDIISQILVKLDYPEYLDIEDVLSSQIFDDIKSIINNLEILINNSYKGEILLSGLKTVIVGSPNAGKSSLLNVLAKTDKAIVSDIKGTTRDVVECSVNLGMINLLLLDTAGLRDTNETIESMGVAKAHALINEAQLILFVIDKNKGFDKDNQLIYQQIKNKPHLCIINKCDDKQDITYHLDHEICISVKNDYHLDMIETQILNLFNIKDMSFIDNGLITNTYQQAELLKAKDVLQQCLRNIEIGLEIDIIEIDLKQALYHVSQILGNNINEDIIDTLFNNYCLGK